MIDTIDCNNYIVTMIIWTPTLDKKQPLYRSLADAIADSVRKGQHKAGDRLPTHRELADALNVTIGTVTRGYAEAERRGLTYAVVGRGTFIRGETSDDPWPDETKASMGSVDFTLSLPTTLPNEGALFAETLQKIAANPRIDRLLQYTAETGAPHQKEIAVSWLNRLGLGRKATDVLVTAGSQQGLNIVLPSLLAPGQVMVCGELTYPSIKLQARNYGVRLRGVALDGEGICPHALERACRQEPPPAALYVLPTLQNPTSALMSQERRERIAELARQYDLLIIEDDVHAFLLEELQKPIAVYAPERTVYLASVAKCLAAGLRTGFILAPNHHLARLRSGIHASMWMAPPLMVEVTTRWLADGTANSLIAEKRRVVAQRQETVASVLAGQRLRAHPQGYQVWLELPEPWTTDAFLTEALEQGVKMIGAGAFAVSRANIPHAVRLSIGLPKQAEFVQGLRTVAQILSQDLPAAY